MNVAKISKHQRTELKYEHDSGVRKYILADPSSVIKHDQPDDLNAIAEVTSLHALRESLENQQKKLQVQTGIVSRKIGEAKRDKQDITEILSSMKVLSAEKKTLSNKIKKINQDILKYFPRKLSSKGEAATNISEDRDRIYSSSIIDIDTITIRVLGENRNKDELDKWNDYVTGNSASCIHHRAEWRDIFSESYGHDSIYFYAHDSSNRMVGVLPLVHIQSLLFGNQLVSMPFFQRGGAIADHYLIEQKLIEYAVRYAKKIKVDHIEFRDDIARTQYNTSMVVQTHKVNMMLSLPDYEEALWRNFSAKLRAQIRRSQREQPEVRFGSRELLNDFYSVYSRNMRDLGSPVQSKQFIKNILLQFPENSWLVVVYLNHRPVSGGFLLGLDRTMEIPLASTIRDVNHLSINMFLYWEVLKFAVKQEYVKFDFGRSSKDAGTYKFKRQWGAKPKQLFWNYWLGESNKLPSLSPSSPKYAFVIYVWKRLPVIITQWLGPKLVKNIP